VWRVYGNRATFVQNDSEQLCANTGDTSHDRLSIFHRHMPIQRSCRSPIQSRRIILDTTQHTHRIQHSLWHSVPERLWFPIVTRCHFLGCVSSVQRNARLASGGLAEEIERLRASRWRETSRSAVRRAPPKATASGLISSKVVYSATACRARGGRR
jgi:hypothetical protein